MHEEILATGKIVPSASLILQGFGSFPCRDGDNSLDDNVVEDGEEDMTLMAMKTVAMVVGFFAVLRTIPNIMLRVEV